VSVFTVTLFAFTHTTHSFAKQYPARPSPGPTIDQLKTKDFTVKTLDGQSVSLNTLLGEGKPVLIDFWATWCGPCVRATPMLASLAKARAKDPRFVVLSISDEAAGAASKIRSFATVNKIAWPMIHDPSHRLNAMYQVRGIPTYVVIGADGVIRERVVGYGTGTRPRLDQAITNALRSMGK
jgi:thiol-disulfide isomerase/thioredoxin